MFHTFETAKLSSSSPTDLDASSEPQKQRSRRTSTVRACEPCRRRKIRCNGEHPCETCQWYHKADSCHYTEPRVRSIPSRKSIEKISATLQEYRGVLQQLFPNIHPDALSTLPREKLLELINQNGLYQPPSPAISQSVDSNLTPTTTAEAGSLESLQTMPEEASDGTETSSNGEPGISDDVNALSLSVKQSSSYLGISSIAAVLRVILWIDPEAQAYFCRTPDRTAAASRAQSHPPELYQNPSVISHLMPEGNIIPYDGLDLVNSYFTYVHCLFPLLEEQSFRETFIMAKRHDTRWLALVNIVFAMGSIAASNADDVSHRFYFAKAKQYLGLECLGSAHLETVQALGIMGGYYLHYAQQPNLANAVMGATLRMATALGLHREYVESRVSTPRSRVPYAVDMRRRVWWCIFCLDTWANMTLGRPSMGRIGHAITARPPQYADDRGQGIAVLSLIENIQFCKIATQIQDALATSPLVPFAEMNTLDNQLVDWEKNLPPLLKNFEPCPDSVYTARTLTRWRYQNQRIVLHRPILLSYAMRRIPSAAVRAEERAAIEKCRTVAAETIRDISSSWRPNQISGWNGVWFLFQASMVPLLSLFTDPQDMALTEACRSQVEIVMAALTQMIGWSPTVQRSLEVVSRIFEASKRLSADETRYEADWTARGGENQSDLQNMWDSLNWSSSWDAQDFQFDDQYWDYGDPFDATFPTSVMFYQQG